MRERDFNLELLFFLNKLKNNENFSLSRWGDGELLILEKKFIDLRNKKNGEFRYDPNLDNYRTPREKLLESYKYKDDNYYIGVACKCCVGAEKCEYMKKLSLQNEDNLTWANIFVNSNYYKFMNLFNKEFQNHKINMIVNKNASLDNLPFKVEKSYKVGADAWYSNYNLIDEISNHIIDKNIKNNIFLFSAGPLSNILTYELWKVSKDNTYIDIGSVYDKLLCMKPTRGYLLGAETLNKKCIW